MLADPAAAQPAAEPKLQENVQVLVDQLEARVIDLEFKHLRKAVSKFIRKNQDLQATQLGAWRTTDSELRATSLLVGDLVLRMVFDPKTSTLLLIPHGGCMENSAALAPGVFDWASDGVENPERLTFPRPRFPPRAQLERVSGTVVLQAILQKDGTIGALQQARYKPATQHGEPIETVVTVGVTYSFGSGR